jgi:thiol-disulfide isomerase/thioredoxin
MLALPAATLWAQGIRWQQDLESAKNVARQTGRLVLVHFWTPECAPCVTLEQQVFNQPGVAGAIEAQFVPVKLDANQNSATAQGFGITRVPTDVIITPDGAVVGKLVSPPTPSAYVAEVTQVAADYSSKLGAPFAKSIASAPLPSQINPAYANLALAPTTQPVVAQLSVSQSTPAATTVPLAPGTNSDSTSITTDRLAAAPISTERQYSAPSTPSFNQPPFSPPADELPNQPLTTPPPTPAANPHYAAGNVTPPPFASTPVATTPRMSPPVSTSLVAVAPAVPTAQPQQPSYVPPAAPAASSPLPSSPLHSNPLHSNPLPSNRRRRRRPRRVPRPMRINCRPARRRWGSMAIAP